MVDFQKGEKQANIDWSLCEALRNTNVNGLPKALIIYDIMCQYHIHLLDRVNRNPFLHLPEITLEKGIGQFHVHGHQETCLFRFSTSFIPGAGQVDGEVLERLWSVLNNISRSTRTATLAHRAEILDDHMNDWNWKKLVGMGKPCENQTANLPNATTLWTVPALCLKYNQAKAAVVAAREYHQALTGAADQDDVREWTREIEIAESQQHRDPKAMDMMKTRVPPREFCHIRKAITI